MKVKLRDSLLAWAIIEIAVMVFCWFGTSALIDTIGLEAVGRGVTPTTVLLSVAMGVSILLWGKLNDLSSLASLSASERDRLRLQVARRVRSLVILVVFFVGFVLFELIAVAVSTSKWDLAGPLLIGVGVGLGASMLLIAGVMVDLNEVAAFRWEIEGSDQAKKRRDGALAELTKAEGGFEGDENIQGYKRVINGR